MEVDHFTIYVERLAEGAVEHVNLSVPADFLEVNEADLSYQSPILLKGQAYIAENELVMCFDIQAVANMRCTLCSEAVEVPIDIKKVYFAEPLETMKSGLFSFKDLVRETILLETPRFVKCGGQICQREDQISKYLKTKESPSKQGHDDEDGYHPFADLKFEE